MTAYTRRTYSELLAQIETDLAAMPAVLREPLSVGWARACHGEHAFLEWVDRQCSPSTCDLERLYDWATLYKVERLSATAATGQVTITGTVGAIALAASVLRAPSGLEYQLTAAVTLSGISASANVRCTTIGLDGNVAEGTALIFVDPNLGIASSATVGAGGLSGGADAELLEDWRARVVEEWQQIVTIGARSGKKEDYRYWAKAAHPSVTGALVQLHTLGIGTVVVRPICNALANRLPSAAVLSAVQVYLQDASHDGVAPATAEVSVASPTTRAVAVTLHLEPLVDTAPNRAAIALALSALTLAKKTDEATLLLSEIDSAIATVTSQYTRSLPSANLACAAGEIFVAPTLTWI